MDIILNSISPAECNITLTVSTTDVNKVLDNTIKDFAKNKTLDGFPKGKIPAQVIEEHFSKDIKKRATSDLIESASQEALKKKNLIPITDLAYKIEEAKEVERNTTFSFSFSFEVLPPLVLPENFEKISIEVTEPMILPSEMPKIFEKIQNQFAKLEEIEQGLPQEDNVVIADILVTHEGENVSGMTVKNMPIQIKEQSAMPEIIALLRTMKKDEEKKTTINISKSYPDPKLQDKEADIFIHVYSINKVILPQVNDELAKKAGFDNLEKLQKQLFFQTMSNKMIINKTKAQNQLLEGLLKDLEFAIPTSLIKSAYASFMEETVDMLHKKGLDEKAIQPLLKTFHDEATKDSTQRAKSQAFLMAIGYREGLQATDKDVMKFVDKLAKENKQDLKTLYEKLWKSGMIVEIKNQILSSKALEFMYSKIKKIVVDINGKPVEIPKQQSFNR